MQTLHGDQQRQHEKQQPDGVGQRDTPGVVVNVVAGGPADGAAALRDWPGALGAYEVFAAHVVGPFGTCRPPTSTMLDVPA